MRATRIRTLVLLALGVAGLGWLVLGVADRRGIHPGPVHWMVDVVLALLTVLVLVCGWRVRDYLRGRRPDLSPLRAARTLVLATASAITGALLTGWYAAQALVVAGDLMIEPRRERAIAAVVAAALAAALSVAGLVVERWCRLRGDSGDEPGAGRRPEGSADPA